MKVPMGTHALIGLAIGIVVVAVVSGLIFLGPPSQQRAHELDERRVEDLRGITRAADLYSTRHGRLPTSLDELSRESGVSVNSHDPRTTRSYGYRILSDEKYELCAEFEDRSSSPAPATPPDGGFWSHAAGRQCFQPRVEEVLR